jgi:membrane-associated phospholipid phosphatase
VRTTDYVVNLALTGVLIVGAYQFYFWCQRHGPLEARELPSFLDDLVPYAPHWVWVYSFLYVPAILYVNLALDSPQQFTRVASSYMLLMAMQAACFIAFPVRTPKSWRQRTDHQGLSQRFLALLQRFDGPSNSFPSMHTSVAMLTALHLFDRHGLAAFALPALIGLSCVFTKQHYIVDVPAGAALGWLTHNAYMHLILS